MQLFLAAFESVPDPRAENTRHDLVEILVIAFVAVLCGATSCSEMAEFGREKLKFLKRFLKLKHGIPSHDTFSTVLRMLDPKALDAAFGRLTATLLEALAKGGVIAIDGKSLKGAYDKGESLHAQHDGLGLCRGSPSHSRLAGGQGRQRGRSRAQADRPHRSQGADRHRRCAALPSPDGRRPSLAKGGDYCFALKGNQEGLLSDARACLSKARKRHPDAKTETTGTAASRRASASS